MSNKTLYDEVTAKIVELLERGTKPWSAPWTADEGFRLPYNFSTHKPYRGINTILLWMCAEKKNFKRHSWLTYRQARELGGGVKRGEQGVHCVFYQLSEVANKNTGHIENIPLIKRFVLFNFDQVEGIDLPESSHSQFNPIKKAEFLMLSSDAIIKHGFNHACYRKKDDVICLPETHSFSRAEDYYATALHELTHWTGHGSRLNRLEPCQRFADEAYAFEELIAEMGSAFLCAEAGIKGELENHASYLESWLTILKKDKRAIFKAASMAAKAHDYVLDFSKV